MEAGPPPSIRARIAAVLAKLDLYVVAIVGMVGLASIAPARGEVAVSLDRLVDFLIALLFFLYGARLPREAVVEGITNWKLQLTVVASTFVLFPLLGVLLRPATESWLGTPLYAGLLFLCLLPSTVQSSIAFTSIARGNVPAALCAASVSNVAGVVITPLLVGWLLDPQGGGGFSTKAIRDMVLQLLAPFAAGQLLRPWIGAWMARHRHLLGYIDRGSILMVVYSAFSEGVVAGIWQRLDWIKLAGLAGLCAALLAVVLVATTAASRRFGFPTADEVAVVFCGSKKSMATGIPMANVLFPAASVGLMVLPLMIFHQIQLMVCATLAGRYAARVTRGLP